MNESIKKCLEFTGEELNSKTSARNYHIQSQIFRKDYYLKYAKGKMRTFGLKPFLTI